MLYVDGYNVLFHISSDTPLQEGRERLIDRLVEKQIPLVIVFDANSTEEEIQRHHVGSLEVVYTSPGETADAYLISECGRRKGLTLVTNDKPLARQAKSLGASIISVEAFLKGLDARESPLSEEPTMSPNEFQRWLTIFENKSGSS